MPDGIKNLFADERKARELQMRENEKLFYQAITPNQQTEVQDGDKPKTTQSVPKETPIAVPPQATFPSMYVETPKETQKLPTVLSDEEIMRQRVEEKYKQAKHPDINKENINTQQTQQSTYVPQWQSMYDENKPTTSQKPQEQPIDFSKTPEERKWEEFQKTQDFNQAAHPISKSFTLETIEPIRKELNPVLDKKIEEYDKLQPSWLADQIGLKNIHPMPKNEQEAIGYDVKSGLYDENRINYRIAQNLLIDAKNTLNAPTKEEGGGYTSGLGQEIKKLDTWVTLVGLADNLQKSRVVELGQSGKPLLKSEEALLDAIFNYYYISNARAGNISKSYSGGQMAGQSIPFMVDFVMTGGFAEGTSTGLSKVMAQHIERKLITKLGEEGYKKLTKVGVDRLIKAPIKLAGELTTGAKQAVISPTFYTGVLEETMAKPVEKKEGGGYVYMQGAPVQDAIVRGMTEFMFERSGEFLGDVLTPVGKLLKNTNYLNKISSTPIGQFGKLFYDGSGKFAKAIKLTGFNGLPSELGEEVLGQTANYLMGVSTKEEMNEFFSKDNLQTMILGFLPMTVISGAGNVMSKVKVNYDHKQAIKNINTTFGENAPQIVMSIDNATPNQLSSLIDDVLLNNNGYVGNKITDKGKQMLGAIVGYAGSKAKVEAMNGVAQDEFKELASPREVLITEENGKHKVSLLDAKGEPYVEKSFDDLEAAEKYKGTLEQMYLTTNNEVDNKINEQLHEVSKKTLNGLMVLKANNKNTNGEDVIISATINGISDDVLGVSNGTTVYVKANNGQQSIVNYVENNELKRAVIPNEFLIEQEETTLTDAFTQQMKVAAETIHKTVAQGNQIIMEQLASEENETVNDYSTKKAGHKIKYNGKEATIIQTTMDNDKNKYADIETEDGEVIKGVLLRSVKNPKTATFTVGKKKVEFTKSVETGHLQSELYSQSEAETVKNSISVTPENTVEIKKQKNPTNPSEVGYRVVVRKKTDAELQNEKEKLSILDNLKEEVKNYGLYLRSGEKILRVDAEILSMNDDGTFNIIIKDANTQWRMENITIENQSKLRAEYENKPEIQEQTETQQEQSPTEQSKYPLTKDGEIDYSQIEDVNVYADALREEFPNEEVQIIDGLISEQNEILNKSAKLSVIEKRRVAKKVQLELDKLNKVKELFKTQENNIKEGVSEKTENGYKFKTQITPEQKQQQIADTESSKQPVETPTSKEALQANLDEQIEEQNVNTSPTEAQKKAGNYKKGHVTVQGMDISVENPKGSVRSGKDEDGKAWEHEMKSHYGYFLKTEGKDGDHIDVFIGEAPESDKIYVIDQVNPKTKAFDESKVMVGYNSPEEAKAAYMENYDNDWKGFSAITEVSIEDFKKWAYDGKRQRKPFNEYKETTQPTEKVKESWEMTNEELESEINVYENTIKERESYILKSNTPLTGSNSGIGTLTESELNRFTSLTNEQQRRNTISSEEARKRRDESRAKRLAERNESDINNTEEQPIAEEIKQQKPTSTKKQNKQTTTITNTINTSIEKLPIKLQNQTLPIANKTVGVKNGMLVATNLNVYVETPTDKADGVYNILGSNKLMESTKNIDEFPVVPQVEGEFIDLPLTISDLSSRVNEVVNDFTRPAFQTAHIQSDNGKLSIMSTDGNSLRVKIVDTNTPDFAINIDRETLNTLKKLKGDAPIRMKFDNKYVVFDLGGGTKITARHPQEKYPNINAVMPNLVDYNEIKLNGNLNEVIQNANDYYKNKAKDDIKTYKSAIIINVGGISYFVSSELLSKYGNNTIYVHKTNNSPALIFKDTTNDTFGLFMPMFNMDEYYTENNLKRFEIDAEVVNTEVDIPEYNNIPVNTNPQFSATQAEVTNTQLSNLTSQERVARVQEAIEQINDGKVVEYVDDMNAYLLEAYANNQEVLDRLAELQQTGGIIGGITQGDTIVINTNRATISGCLSTFEHERQHVEVRINPLWQQIKQDIIQNVNAKKLDDAVAILSGTDFYRGIPVDELADEYIAHIIQHVFENKIINTNLEYQKIIEDEYRRQNSNRFSGIDEWGTRTDNPTTESGGQLTIDYEAERDRFLGSTQIDAEEQKIRDRETTTTPLFQAVGGESTSINTTVGELSTNTNIDNASQSSNVRASYIDKYLEIKKALSGKNTNIIEAYQNVLQFIEALANDKTWSKWDKTAIPQLKSIRDSVRELKKAGALFSIRKKLDMAMELVLQRQYTTAEHIINKFAKLKLEGTTTKGVKTQKKVDTSTQIFFTTLNSALSKDQETSVIAERIADLNIKLSETTDQATKDNFEAQIRALTLLHQHKAEQNRLGLNVNTIASEIDDISKEFALRDNRKEIMTAYNKISANNKKLDNATEREKVDIFEENIKLKDKITKLQSERNAIKGDIKHDKRNKAKLPILKEMLLNARLSQQNEMEWFIEELDGILREGISAKRAFVAKEKAHKEQIIEEALRAIDYTTDKSFMNPNKKENRKTLWSKFIHSIDSFASMLKMLDVNAPDGRGLLFTRFFTNGIMEASKTEQLGLKASTLKLDKKIQEIFGKGFHLTQLQKLCKQTNGAVVTLKSPKEVKNIESGERDITYNEEERVLDNGQALYIYAIAKMPDGLIKLNAMGIDQEQIDAVADTLSDELKQYQDWIQEEFLPELRVKYNETHIQLFGTQLDQIENYFKLNISRGDLQQETQIEDSAGYYGLPKTDTGSILKRVYNKNAIDIENSNAIETLIEHLHKMEHWNAYAPIIKDLNTLNSNPAFKKHINRYIYNGAAEDFKTASQIAVGAYVPKGRGGIEDAIVASMKLYAAGKIALRLNTALKQSLALIQILGYGDMALVRHSLRAAVNPLSIKWCMRSIPDFEKRWKDRAGGDSNLMIRGDMDGTAFEKLHTRISDLASKGMLPNAAVDLWSCAIVAKGMYDTKLSYYKNRGYSEEESIDLALKDAEIAYNETMQSAEAGYLSAVQKDKTWWSATFSLFNNASIAYQRLLIEGLKGIGKQLSPKQRADMIAFQKAKYLGLGRSVADADKFAKSDVNKALRKNIMQVAMNGYIVQLVWNLGSAVGLMKAVQYLIVFSGDDDDAKDRALEELKDDLNKSALKSFTTPIRGLPSGKELESMVELYLNGWNIRQINIESNPLISDTKEFSINMSEGFKNNDWVRILNGLVRYGVGFAGLDLNTLANISYSIFDVIENHENITTTDVIYDLSLLLNAPRSEQKFLSVSLREGDTYQDIMQRYISLKRVHKYGVFSPLTNVEDKRATQDVSKMVNVQYYTLRDMLREYENIADKYNKKNKDNIISIYENQTFSDANSLMNSLEYDAKNSVLSSDQLNEIRKAIKTLENDESLDKMYKDMNIFLWKSSTEEPNETEM